MEFLEIASTIPALKDWSIITAYRGSISHGLYLPGTDPHSIDDKDIMAICVPPREYYLGLNQFGSRETLEIKQDEWDIVIYEVRKFVKLLMVGNPNVLALLWLNDEHYLKMTYAGEMLIDHRDLFVGRHVYHAFVGYANAQLKKMTQFTVNGYMGARRKALVDEFGYDVKNAAHLIRLLRMGKEFMQTGELKVYRTKDSEELLDIKHGKWSLERVKEQAEQEFIEAKLAYANSTLPDCVDEEKIEKLLMQVIQERT